MREEGEGEGGGRGRRERVRERVREEGEGGGRGKTCSVVDPGVLMYVPPHTLAHWAWYVSDIHIFFRHST